MKEINQKTLSELAEKMPAINELDEGKYSGGTFYIDYQGGALGRVGHSDRLALLGTQQMYEYARNHKLEDYGIDLYEATDDSFPSGSIHNGEHVQKNVFSNYAKWTIDYTGAVKVIRDWSNYDDLFYIPSSHHGGVSGVLCFNAVWSGMIFSHEGLTQKLKEVQKTMFENPDSPTGNIEDPNDPIQKKINELMAIIQDLNKKEGMEIDEKKKKKMYEESQPQRRYCANQIYSLWREQGHAGAGYELFDAYKKCRVKDFIG